MLTFVYMFACVFFPFHRSPHSAHCSISFAFDYYWCGVCVASWWFLSPRECAHSLQLLQNSCFFLLSFLFSVGPRSVSPPPSASFGRVHRAYVQRVLLPSDWTGPSSPLLIASSKVRRISPVCRCLLNYFFFFFFFISFLICFFFFAPIGNSCIFSYSKFVRRKTYGSCALEFSYVWVSSESCSVQKCMRMGFWVAMHLNWLSRRVLCKRSANLPSHSSAYGPISVANVVAIGTVELSVRHEKSNWKSAFGKWKHFWREFPLFLAFFLLMFDENASDEISYNKTDVSANVLCRLEPNELIDSKQRNRNQQKKKKYFQHKQVVKNTNLMKIFIQKHMRDCEKWTSFECIDDDTIDRRRQWLGVESKTENKNKENPWIAITYFIIISKIYFDKNRCDVRTCERAIERESRHDRAFARWVICRLLPVDHPKHARDRRPIWLMHSANRSFDFSHRNEKRTRKTREELKDCICILVWNILENGMRIRWIGTLGRFLR